jgi:hypothetical protein
MSGAPRGGSFVGSSEEFADEQVAIRHRGPRDVAGGRRVGVVGVSHARRSAVPAARPARCRRLAGYVCFPFLRLRTAVRSVLRDMVGGPTVRWAHKGSVAGPPAAAVFGAEVGRHGLNERQAVSGRAVIKRRLGL